MSDDEFISYDDSDSGVSYSPEPDHEDEDDYIGKELIFNRELVSTVLEMTWTCFIYILDSSFSS